MEFSVESRERLIQRGRVYLDVLHARTEDGMGDFIVVSIGSGVGVVPVTNDGRFLMVREYRIGAGEEQWNWPAGGLEVGEDVEQCARRELMEETGYQAGELTYIGRFNSAPSYLEGALHYYLSTDLTKINSMRDEPLLVEAGLFTKEEVKKLIANGGIKHTGTIAAFFLALEHLASANE